MMMGLYRIVTTVAGPLISRHLAKRARSGREDPERAAERRGAAGLVRPSDKLIWLHAASVGETVSVMPLIERLLKNNPACQILVTTGTVTSAKLCGDMLPDGAFHQYAPVDRPAWVNRFLDHWQPDLALWVESELWPNLLDGIRRRNIPAALINTRISARSHRRWQRFPRFAKSLLGTFNVCLAPDDDQATRLRDLGATHIVVTGNLKDAAGPLPVDRVELLRLTGLVAARPVWLAASTPPGEEAMAEHIHESLKPKFTGLLTIIAPRHPERGAEIAQGLEKSGLVVARRSLGHEIQENTDVYLADTLGELGLIYRLATIAFVGGSLVPHGGQNLREPARLHCAILFGRHVENFASVADQLIAIGAGRKVSDDDALKRAVSALLMEPDAAQAMAEAGKRLTGHGSAIVDAVVDTLAPQLAPLHEGSQEGSGGDDNASA